MSGALIAAGVIAAGTAAYAGYSQNKAAKTAANAMREGVQTFDPIRPQDPLTIDWQRAANNSLGFNLNNVGQRNELVRLTNNLNTREAQRMYRTFQPSFDSLQAQIGQNALSFSRGELPADVVNQMGRQAAQRGLASGFGQGARGGGGALGSSLLRGLGLTSLDLSKFGTQMAMNASLQAKQLSPPLYDPSALMINPNQAIGYEAQNVGIQNDAARYWNQLQNQALMGNVSAQNTANTNATNTELAGQLAQAQAIQQAGASVGGAMGTYATNQPYIPQGQTNAFAGAGMTGQVGTGYRLY